MMAYTQSQIDALKDAIATGVRTVRHGETETEYRSLAEMMAILAQMEAALATRRRRTVARFTSGV
jgi:hypothetical protein